MRSAALLAYTFTASCGGTLRHAWLLAVVACQSVEHTTEVTHVSGHRRGDGATESQDGMAATSNDVVPHLSDTSLSTSLDACRGECAVHDELPDADALVPSTSDGHGGGAPPGEANGRLPCPPGTESCRCYPNNTCDVLDGTPMDCVSGTCRPHAALADPHGLGTPCAVDLDCGAHEGVPLVCTGGACVFPGCVAGEAGCACPSFGACAAGLNCEGGFCVAPDCRPGAQGCPCAAGVCDAPTQCVRGVCRVGEARLANLVAPAGGRACDARVTLPASGRVTVTFDPAVRGADFRTAGVLGLSFVARQDAPLPAAPIQFDSADPATVAALQITDFTCYDRQGRALPGARLSLDR